MKVIVLKAKPRMRDVNNEPLVVGSEAYVKPEDGNRWAGIGLVKILHHHEEPDPAQDAAESQQNNGVNDDGIRQE